MSFAIARNADYSRGSSVSITATFLGAHARAATTSSIGEFRWRATLLPQLEFIRGLAHCDEGWDAHGSKPAAVEVIAKAQSFLKAFWDKYSDASLYRKPFIALSEEGEVVFEWWGGERKLTIYIAPTGSTFLKSWGVDTVSQMDEGELINDEIPDTLWLWLVNG